MSKPQPHHFENPALRNMTIQMAIPISNVTIRNTTRKSRTPEGRASYYHAKTGLQMKMGKFLHVFSPQWFML